MNWSIHHSDVTVSTNIDARKGVHGDVFTASMQTGGRGRLDHKWVSPPGENLLMSLVLSAGGLSPSRVATLPIAAGLAVVEGLRVLTAGRSGDSPLFLGHGGDCPLALKWPNDVLLEGKKLAGILCERHGDDVIVGIGVNVNQQKFPKNLQKRATSLFLSGTVPNGSRGTVPVARVRDAILGAMSGLYDEWFSRGLSPFIPRISAIDFLKGKFVEVIQTDNDDAPLSGVCGGISADGTLQVGGRAVWAGEAHVASAVDNL